MWLSLFFVLAIKVVAPEKVTGLLNLDYKIQLENTGVTPETLDIFLCFDKTEMRLRYVQVYLENVPLLERILRYGYKEFECSHKWKTQYYDSLMEDTMYADSGCYFCKQWGQKCGELLDNYTLADSNAYLRTVPYIVCEPRWVNIGELDIEHLKKVKARVEALDSVALDVEGAITKTNAKQWIKRYRKYMGRKKVLNTVFQERVVNGKLKTLNVIHKEKFVKGKLDDVILSARQTIKFKFGFRRLPPEEWLAKPKEWRDANPWLLLPKYQSGKQGVVVKNNQGKVLAEVFHK